MMDVLLNTEYEYYLSKYVRASEGYIQSVAYEWLQTGFGLVIGFIQRRNLS
jgi:hypothetical protein